MQIHVSRALSTDLKRFLVQAPVNLQAMQWYAHRVHVLGRKCVIAMEARSRYAIVMTGLRKADFDQFPTLFHDRLWREAVTICNLDEVRSERLAGLVDLVAQPVEIITGFDRSVLAHIRDVVWVLEDKAQEVGSLPGSAAEEFAFGLYVNETPRFRGGDPESIYPLKVMRGFWLGLLERTERRNSPDNVVPFNRLH
ncbi:DUF6933 domain-containing protein [Thioalkalivibrio denitrificans]|nr:hypothetical protein [Thioalkalivibrio denitrificans]